MYHSSSNRKSNGALLCGLFFGLCDERSVLPHGNNLKRTHPYIRTSRETMEKLGDNLSSGKSVIEVSDLTLEKPKKPLKSASQSQQPRDKKLVQNCKGLLNSKKNKTNETLKRNKLMKKMKSMKCSINFKKLI